MSTATGYGLLVIGGGNMGGAIVRGAIKGRTFSAASICIIDPDPAKRAAFEREGVATAETIPADAASLHTGTIVLWAVKPQIFPAAAEAYQSATASIVPGNPPRLGVSIMAGITAAAATRQTGTPVIVRTMPNLPAQLGLGVTAVCRPAGASDADMAAVQSLMGAVGTVVHLAEPLLDGFTAVAGSGPAYVFYLAEAMVRSAIAQGISPAQADAIVRQTLSGAAALLASRTDATPAQLRSEVTSKGGATAAAIAVLDAAGVADALVRAIDAGTARSGELGGASKR